MTVEELARVIELADEEENIYCYEDNGKLFASFANREGVIVEVLTPMQLKLLNEGKLDNDDIVQIIYSLKRIANN